MRYVSTLISTFALAACATTGTGTSTGNSNEPGIGGPVKIGDNLYKLGGSGSKTDTSGGAVKVRFFQQATTFCANNGMAMAPGKFTSRDASAGAPASAEIQFRCVPR